MTATTGRPLKVGIQLPEVERDVRWPEYLDMARAIEDLGFDSIWLGDHLLYRYEDGPARGPWEAWTSLAAIAASTSRIELGPLVAAPTSTTRRCSPSWPRRSTRSAAAGSSSASAPAGTRPSSGLRLPVRPPDLPLRGGVHDHPDAPARGRDRLRRPLVPGPRLRAPAARPAAGRPAADDRHERAADARAHAAPRRPVEHLVPPREPPGRRRAAPRQVDEACRAVGRDPADLEKTSAVLVGCRAGPAASRFEEGGIPPVAASPPRWPSPARLRRARASPRSSSSLDPITTSPSRRSLPSCELLDSERVRPPAAANETAC